MATVSLNEPWELRFPAGWGAPAAIQIQELKPWKELDVSAEAKTFSGTVEYTSTFNIEKKSGMQFILNLGDVTSTWFNRLVYDAAQPEVNRKTWVLKWPDSHKACMVATKVCTAITPRRAQNFARP